MFPEAKQLEMISLPGIRVFNSDMAPFPGRGRSMHEMLIPL